MSTLIELGVPLDELQRALSAQGLVVVNNLKTKRRRLVRIPAFLESDATCAAERSVEHLPRRDNRIVEPLHHHAHPRGRGVSDFSVKQRRRQL